VDRHGRAWTGVAPVVTVDVARRAAGDEGSERSRWVMRPADRSRRDDFVDRLLIRITIYVYRMLLDWAQPCQEVAPLFAPRPVEGGTPGGNAITANPQLCR
jgi:hypothetical protein